MSNHAVENGIVQHLSVSQLQAFDRCQRLWYFDKILHLPGKVFKGQAVGLEGHARLETYYDTGGDTDVLGPMERLGVERGFVPTPHALYLSEHHIGDAVPAYLGGPPVGLDAVGVPVEGYIDLVDLSVYLSEHTVTVTDWKFKKDIDAYGIKERDIFNPLNEAGVQLIGYAEWARRQFKQARFIRAGHVTFQTQGARDVTAVYDTIEVDKLPALWENVCRNVPQLRKVALEKDWSKVTPTFTACSKYGGCSYRDKCFDPLSRLASAIFASSSTVNLKREGVNMGLLSDSAVEAPVTPPAVFVTPPDAPEPTIISTPGSKVIVEDHTVDAPPASSTEVLTPGASGFVPMVPKRRGRPPKVQSTSPADTAATATAVQSPVSAGGVLSASSATRAAPATAEPTGPVAGSADDAPFSAGSGVFLYFNCIPQGRATDTLDAFTRRVEADFIKAAKKHGLVPDSLTDLRASTSSDLGYGKWKAYLAAATAGSVGDLGPGHYVVCTTDERVICVAEELATAQSVTVVRGVR